MQSELPILLRREINTKVGRPKMHKVFFTLQNHATSTHALTLPPFAYPPALCFYPESLPMLSHPSTTLAPFLAFHVP